MKKWILVLLLIIATVAFCINKKKKLKRLAVNYEDIPYVDFEIDIKYLITEVEIDRVKIGDSYTSHKKKLKETQQKNRTIFFRVFDLYNNEKEKIAFVYIDPFDKKSINTIEIISPHYKTEKGIGVGNTFFELKKNYPNSETHGSEIAGRTIVMAGDYHFLLENTIFSSYNVDESKIHPSTKIKKIILRK
jgi:hypothetical protein